MTFAGAYYGRMADTRTCEQCGTQFIPRREHSRFCSGDCRRAWNREHTGNASVSSAALDWSLSAMTEATGRLGRARLADARHAAVAVSDATWWVTIVDATLVRYHPNSYDAALDAQPADRRAEIEETLAGLRFVRNQMGVHLDPTEFVRGRTWQAVDPPATQELSPAGQEWEHGRYRAYQERLAGQDVVRAFNLAAGFLRVAAEGANAWIPGEAPPPPDRRRGGALGGAPP